MAERIILARDGRRRACIVLPAGADRVVRFAGAELSRYLEMMSGVVLTVEDESRLDPLASDAPCICLGAGDWEEKLGAALDPCCGPFDGFTLRTVDGNVFVRGHNSRSTLYGVYDLLERLGCRFVEPGIEEVPELRTIAVPPLNCKEVAAFPLRNIFRNIVAMRKQDRFEFLNPDLHLPQIDWMAKRRLNHYEFYVDFFRYDLWERHKDKVLEALLDRGFDLEVTHHSIHYFCPPDENHDFGDYGPETYQRNHPDWYVAARECGARGRWQTRVGLTEVQKVIVERYLDYLRRNAELKILGLWPDDIPMNAPYRGLSRTDGYVKFWNVVGKALAGELPGKLLGIIAYFELIEPPRRIAPDPNLHCWFCPIAGNYMYPISDRRNERFVEHLKGWIARMPPYRTANFEYYGWSMPLIPMREKMRKDLQLYRELNSGGIYAWSGFTYNILGQDYRWALDFFVLTHLLWDPRADVRELERLWASHVFGEAAPQVLDFYDLLKQAHRKEARKGLAPNYQWISLDTLRRAQQVLASARKKAAGPETVRRIDLLEKTAAHGCTEEVWREGPPMRYVGM